MTHSSECKNKNIANGWKIHSLTTHTKAELQELDLGHLLPSFVQMKKHEVERESRDAQELLSNDKSTCDVGSGDSNE